MKQNCAMIKQLKNSYCCIGLMSGTSLDGLDMVLCQLNQNENKWTYTFLKTQSHAYSKYWKESLKSAYTLGGVELLKLHRAYGIWLAERVLKFISDTDARPTLIASHGHTIFHEPEKKLNFQLGDGAVIAAKTGITTISDFRTLDICLNGQGAPLVPIGDQLLFDNYSACVNLGGFANVSCQIDGVRKAWDICPVNYIINQLMQRLGKEMDYNGEFGKTGSIIKDLLDRLQILPYYKQSAPKSLAQEWVDREFMPLLHKFNNYPLQDLIRTCYEHYAEIISHDLNSTPIGDVLFSGGGVYNKFLMELIQQKTNHQIVIPDDQLIEFKEALVFSLLGTLRLSNQINCLSSVTGADYNCSSGVIHWGRK